MSCNTHKPYVFLLAGMLLFFFSPENVSAQLQPGEIPGKITDEPGRFLQPHRFRLDGKTLRFKEVKNVLLNEPRSMPLMKQAIRNRRTGLLVSAGGLGLAWASLIRSQNLGSSAPAGEKTATYILMGTGIAGVFTGEIILLKGNKQFRNSIHAFNNESMLGTPAQQTDTALSKKVLYNPGAVSEAYFQNGKRITHKQVDRLLSRSDKVKPFYIRLEKNKRMARVAAISTLVCLAAPIVSQPGEFNTPVIERSDRNLVFAALAGFTVSLTTWGIAEVNIKQYRYNAYRIHNGETPYPFNRRHKRLISESFQLGLGITPHGLGLMVRF